VMTGSPGPTLPHDAAYSFVLQLMRAGRTGAAARAARVVGHASATGAVRELTVDVCAVDTTRAGAAVDDAAVAPALAADDSMTTAARVRLRKRAILNPTKVSAALRQLHPEAEAVFRDAYLVEFAGRRAPEPRSPPSR
jgi:hypothetical protein